jgi:hypothetical protein
MKIRVLKSFGAYKVGQTFDWGDGIARIYVARGLVAPMVDEQRIESATMEERAERAVLEPKPRKRQK